MNTAKMTTFSYTICLTKYKEIRFEFITCLLFQILFKIHLNLRNLAQIFQFICRKFESVLFLVKIGFWIYVEDLFVEFVAPNWVDITCGPRIFLAAMISNIIQFWLCQFDAI